MGVYYYEHDSNPVNSRIAELFYDFVGFLPRFYCFVGS